MISTLFSGGFTDIQGTAQWCHRIGFFAGNQDTIRAVGGAVVDPNHPQQHAEAQRLGVLGTDFVYSAQVTVQPYVDAHLQFRISDEGRYGIRLRTDSLTFYRFRRENRPCSAAYPSIVAHCPDWTLPIDDPYWLEIRSDQGLALASGSRHTLEVRANGPTFDVLLDGRLMLARPVEDDSFAVGRFGIYVWGEAPLSRVVFADVRATTDPTHLSNFALLYSTAGYEARGTKRALVRTLNDLPSQLFEPGRSRFTLRRDGVIVRSGVLLALPAPSGNPPDIAKTFGMQLWEADFSSVTAEGLYTLHVTFGTSDGMNALQSDPFEIRSKLVTSRMLKPLSILNAEARRAADEDFWRNWIQESGDWSVAVDGAFLADRANAQEGALLRRVFDRNNGPLNMQDFRYIGRITIVSGCDAQMQFRITPTERLAVTLQAGEAGGCPFGTGPGAVRLHCEGSSVPDGGFQCIASKLFPVDQPFHPGQPYDVEILARGTLVTVIVDGMPQLENILVPESTNRTGGFALKAWASTARFDRVQAWEPQVQLEQSPDGVRIPTFLNKPCWEVVPGNPEQDPFKLRCNPKFSQLNGFHDCNNIIGEATSHGAFLAGLMEVWTKRAHTFSQADRESLRRAIMTTALYVEELFQQRNASGEFAHSEMGRVAIYTNLGRHQSLLALYGESAFADKGKIIDRTLARRACERSIQGARWLWSKGTIEDPVAQSVIYARIARCAEREQLSIRDDITGRSYWELAFEAVEMVLSKFAAPGGMASEFRDSGRVIPWFEGVYEVLQSFPDKQGSYIPRLNTIADTLVTHLTREHRCDDTVIGPRCAANGFFVLPQASSIEVATDFDLPRKNWEQMDQVPSVNRPSTLPFLNFYEGNHFAVATSDAVYVGRMTEQRADLRAGLERIASGNFYWVLGLHPGIPASKVARRDSGGTPLQAASFVYNGDAAFARTMEGQRTEASSAKGWVAPWEGSAASPHRETWWIDPQNRWVFPENRALQSIVNGHVIWDQQWDYWNTGKDGWTSGETFLRNDGTFLKAAMLFEDRLFQTTRSNPYDTTQVEFFDTAHIDRIGTGWGFDDPNRTNAAQAGRAANEFCVGKGYNGGRFTGHHIGERLGVLCVPTTARFFDATDEEIRATGWDFNDINVANWAQVARAATGFCNTRGYTGGFFTGHQLPGRRGIICLGSDAARWFDATEQDLSDSGEGFGDINAVPWAKAARAATNICLAKGFLGGFFTGHQVPGKKGIVALYR